MLLRELKAWGAGVGLALVLAGWMASFALAFLAFGDPPPGTPRSGHPVAFAILIFTMATGLGLGVLGIGRSRGQAIASLVLGGVWFLLLAAALVLSP